jgi:hypothetical protein
MCALSATWTYLMLAVRPLGTATCRRLGGPLPHLLATGREAGFLPRMGCPMRTVPLVLLNTSYCSVRYSPRLVMPPAIPRESDRHSAPMWDAASQ